MRFGCPECSGVAVAPFANQVCPSIKWGAPLKSQESLSCALTTRQTYSSDIFNKDEQGQQVPVLVECVDGEFIWDTTTLDYSFWPQRGKKPDRCSL